MIDIETAKQILLGDDTDPNILQSLGLEILDEVIRLQSHIAHHAVWGVRQKNMRTYAIYRQCPECGSIDFSFKFDDEGMHCECDKCDNKWTEKIE